MEMPYCQTKHQKACVCAWNTWIIYIFEAQERASSRERMGEMKRQKITVLLSSYLPCTAKSLYAISSKTWRLFSRMLRRNFRLIHFAHLVRQFCEVDLRRRRSKSWYIVQHFSLLCAKIMACIGHFWPFRPSIAFAKFLKKIKRRSEVASTLKHLIIIQWHTFFPVSVYSPVLKHLYSRC